VTRYVLDTSAVLAHIFREVGGSAVQELLGQEDAVVCIAATSLFEMETVMRRRVPDLARCRSIAELYASEIVEVLPIDARSVREAIAVRDSARSRLPAMDALIAGCAIAHDAVLVHRDPHFDGIPASRLKTLRLPDTEAPPPTSGDVRAVAKESGSSYRVVKTRTKRRTKARP
jgi:predicted nucleic acid-binding protein